MPDDHRLDVLVVKVDGRPLAVDVLSRLTLVSVEESVLLPDLFTLRFDDPHFELFDAGTFDLGVAVEIGLRSEGEPMAVATGEVTALSVEQTGGGRHQLVVHGLDATHRLDREPRSRSFQQVTDADVATRIAGEHGLRAEVDPTSEVHPYLLQAGQTDLAFLRQRADHVGFSLWVSDGVLHFAAAPTGPTPPTLTWGANLHQWRVRFTSSERCDEVVVRGWDHLAKREIEARATPPDPPGTASAATELPAAARRAFGEVKRGAGHLGVTSRGEADELARSLAARTAGNGVLARGEATGDPRIAAGGEVEVQGVGSRLSGTYRLTSVQHVYGPGTPYVTRFTCGGREPAGLPDLLGSSGGKRPERAALVVGVVTNIDDAEGVGRVKVTLPTIAPEDESSWARVVAPGGGSGRGVQWLPEVGDEVVVGFEHGDLRRPFVLGGLWNRHDPPPVSAVEGGEVTVRTLTSREGHRFELRDGARAGATLEAPEIEVTATRRLVLRAPQIEIAADGACTITGTPIRLN